MTASDRAGLEARLQAESPSFSSWSNGPGDRYEVHLHDYDKIVVAVEGSISFGLAGEGVVVALAPGERLDLPAHVEHDAIVGPSGVTCLEAHLPAGTLGTVARGLGSRW